MSTDAAVPVTSRHTLAFIPFFLGLALLAGAAYLWLRAPSFSVPVEAGVRPVGFSLGLDDPEVARIDRQGARAFWQGGDWVFPNGFAAGASLVWPDLERSTPDPALARVKIIPSGGMFPFYRSSGFAAEIETFVRRGGSLICLGQPLGAMYSALPGSPQGVGWAEVASPAKEAVGQAQVALDHPVLAALTRPEFELHFAGFFTKVPGSDRTQVILRDTATGRPVAVAYRHGQGLVVATTMVSDAAALASHLKREEKTALEQILVWARAGGAAQVWQYAPGDTVEMLYTFRPGEAEASEGYVEVHRPDGTLDQSFACPLPEGSGVDVTRPFSITEPRGIWQIVSVRRDAEGRAAGPAANSWFAVGHAPQAPPVDGLHMTVCVPGVSLVAGAVLRITVRLWNDAPSETEVTYRGPAGKHTVKLAAGQGRTLVDEIAPARAGARSLTYEFYGPAGERLGVIRRRVAVDQPDRVFLSLSGPGKAAPGVVAPLALQVLSVNPGDFTADCSLRLVHNGAVLWQEPRRLALHGGYTSRESIKVPIPEGERGRLVVEAALARNGLDLGKTWMEIDVE